MKHTSIVLVMAAALFSVGTPADATNPTVTASEARLRGDAPVPSANAFGFRSTYSTSHLERPATDEKSEHAAQKRGGPPYPSAGAVDFTTTYRTFAFTNPATREKGGGAEEPPATPQPGDEETHEWTECADATHCTRHTRTDRWQREDAPIEPGSDPNEGIGPYGWYPTSWGSSSCANYNACLRIGSFDPF
ncbi:MAG: hypothetical protein LKM32_01075 [Chiayiivirga sp.]|jgi:hypothetical protein|uniref:hypothetical protein n=1 Tax=Chiayiivirga sp. TaxID=2041042 RepID=UPI0025C1CE8E|nr:hypothetical protein [Chiayiivirga sp.]MCI1728029.1 hypothetical protein [Chiayiivirga sp.]